MLFLKLRQVSEQVWNSKTSAEMLTALVQMHRNNKQFCPPTGQVYDIYI